MPSTVIGQIDYDAATHSLRVRFVPTGRRYLYSGVEPEVHAAFRRAFNKGAFFNRHIRGRYAATPLSEAREAPDFLPEGRDGAAVE